MTMSRRAEKEAEEPMVPAGVEGRALGLCGENGGLCCNIGESRKGESTEKWGRKGEKMGQEVREKALRNLLCEMIS